MPGYCKSSRFHGETRSKNSNVLLHARWRRALRNFVLHISPITRVNILFLIVQICRKDTRHHKIIGFPGVNAVNKLLSPNLSQTLRTISEGVRMCTKTHFWQLIYSFDYRPMQFFKVKDIGILSNKIPHSSAVGSTCCSAEVRFWLRAPPSGVGHCYRARKSRLGQLPVPNIRWQTTFLKI